MRSRAAKTSTETRTSFMTEKQEEGRIDQKVDAINEVVDAVTQHNERDAQARKADDGPMRDSYGRFASNAEKQDDEALDKLIGRMEQVQSELNGSDEKSEAKAEDTKEGKEAPKEADKPSKRAIDKARKALELDGWDDGDFDGISEERIVALGKKAADRQAKISKELEAKSKQRTSEDGEAGEEDESAARVARRAEPESQADDDLSDLKPIEELFGEETSNAIAKYVQKALGLTKQQMQQVQQQLSAANEEKAERAVSEARTKLTDKYPELQDEEVYDDVVEEMTALVKIPGKYKDMNALMEAACRLKGLEAKTGKAAKTSPAVQAAKANGTPVVKSQVTQPKSMSLSDREDLALDAIFKGKGRLGARNAWEGS